VVLDDLASEFCDDRVAPLQARHGRRLIACTQPKTPFLTKVFFAFSPSDIPSIKMESYTTIYRDAQHKP